MATGGGGGSATGIGAGGITGSETGRAISCAGTKVLGASLIAPCMRWRSASNEPLGGEGGLGGILREIDGPKSVL